MKKVARLRMPQLEEAESVIKPSASNVAVNKPTRSMSTEGGVRTTGRIKKPKHFFDPSDYDVPRPVRSNNSAHITAQSSNSSERYSNGSNTSLNSDQKKTSRSPSATPELVDVCSVCSKRDAKRGIHAKNKLIQCQNCDKKIHKLCLPIDFEDIDVLMKNYKCTQCRKCAVCNNALVNGQAVSKDLITCAKCAKSYHMQCHVPPVLKYQQFIRTWRCAQCVAPKMNEIHAIIGAENKIVQSHAPNKTNNTSAEKVANAGTDAHCPAPKPTLKENNKRSASESVTQPKQLQQPQAVAREKQYKLQQQHLGVHKSHITTQQQYVEKTQAKQHIASIVQHQPFAENDIKQVKSLNSHAMTNGQTAENRVAATTTSVDAVAAKKPKFSDDSSSIAMVDEAANVSTLSLYSSTDAIDIPTDVKYWTVDKVFEYFSKYFPIEAHVFKEQEIDGMSLLLLKRSDVVKKLPIKLGPSLRLYNLILKIQAQVNDPTLGWNVGQ